MANTRTVKGFVLFIKEKSGTNARGAWTAYSVKLVDERGQEDPRWYQFGFDKPPFKTDRDTSGHGDYVEFQVEDKDDKVSRFVQGSGKILKNAPARTQPQEKKSGGGGRGGYGGGAKVTKSDLFGEIGGYNTEDDVRRMSYSNARDHAIKTVELLLANDGLEITGAKSKAAQAKRFEEITAAIDKLTVQYLFDAATGRKLESVEDAGAVEQSSKPLPDDHDQPADDVPDVTDDDGDDVPPDPDGGEDEEASATF